MERYTSTKKKLTWKHESLKMVESFAAALQCNLFITLVSRTWARKDGFTTAFLTLTETIIKNIYIIQYSAFLNVLFL